MTHDDLSKQKTLKPGKNLNFQFNRQTKSTRNCSFKTRIVVQKGNQPVLEETINQPGAYTVSLVNGTYTLSLIPKRHREPQPIDLE